MVCPRSCVGSLWGYIPKVPLDTLAYISLPFTWSHGHAPSTKEAGKWSLLAGHLATLNQAELC